MSNYSEILLLIGGDDDLHLVEKIEQTFPEIHFSQMTFSRQEPGKKFSTKIFVATGCVTAQELSAHLTEFEIEDPDLVQVFISNENDPEYNGSFKEIKYNA